MIGTSAALAWSIASTVCGITPSSAATTITAMSVTLAPRARMAVKASWPGVSRKVIVLAVVVDLVGADVLRDAARLARDHLGLADRVEQRGLAVVDVAHDRDDRRALDQLVLARRRSSGASSTSSAAWTISIFLSKLVGQHLDRVVGERLRERGHLAELHQLLDHLGSAEAERLGDLLDGGAGVDLRRRLLALRLGRRREVGLDPWGAAPAPASAAGRLLLRRWAARWRRDACESITTRRRRPPPPPPPPP